MSVSVEEGVTWKKKFARGNKRQSDGGGSKRKRGRGDGRSEDKPSPPPKAKVHNSKLQLSGSKMRLIDTRNVNHPPKDRSIKDKGTDPAQRFWIVIDSFLLIIKFV